MHNDHFIAVSHSASLFLSNIGSLLAAQWLCGSSAAIGAKITRLSGLSDGTKIVIGVGASLAVVIVVVLWRLGKIDGMREKEEKILVSV